MDEEGEPEGNGDGAESEGEPELVGGMDRQEATQHQRRDQAGQGSRLLIAEDRGKEAKDEDDLTRSKHEVLPLAVAELSNDDQGAPT